MTGFIYAIGAAEAGLVKIGWSVRPKQRLSEIRTNSPIACQLLGVCPGTQDDEKALHRRFRALHVRGEWFCLKGVVKDFVSTLPPLATPSLPHDPLARAKAIAGGSVGLAKRLGDITPQAITQWKRVPSLRVLAVEECTGVPCHALRPDIYPPEDYEAAA